MRLDLESLGHASSLAAATTLLWDVLRLVDGSDAENPIVAVEDAVVLTPQPKSMVSWPSLYVALCSIVQTCGTIEATETAAGERPAVCQTLLLSRLRPLLRSHWHSLFDERSLAYFSEQGAGTRMKKMKHLVHAVLRWRDERVQWQLAADRRPTLVDKALMFDLELAASTSHNDMILRCHSDEEPRQIEPCPMNISITDARGRRRQQPQRKCPLVARKVYHEVAVDCPVQSPSCLYEGFDDPFEPPPQRDPWAAAATPVTSPTKRETQKFSDRRPLWSPRKPTGHVQTLTFELDSGASTRAPTTPVSSFEELLDQPPSLHQHRVLSPQPANGRMCALVPLWFPCAGVLADRSAIPMGIVERCRTHFEPEQG